MRLSRQQKMDMDCESERTLDTVARAHSSSELDYLPNSMRMNAIALRRLIDSRTPANIAEASLVETEACMEHLKTLWRGVEAGWEATTNIQLTPTQLDEAAQFYTEISESYMLRNAQLHSRHREITQEAAALPNVTGPGAWPRVSTSSGQVIQIQLTEPPKVPKFSGMEIDWANFRAQFEAEVHNNAQLSNAQKLHKLLGALEGRAKQAIGDWPTTDENSYASAWQTLCRQYGNDLNTICAHMSKLFALKTAESLRQILDTTRVTHRQLSLLLSPEKVAEYILLYRLECLMDAESQAQWAMHRATSALPTLQELYDFLEIRASLLAASPNMTSHREEPRSLLQPRNANSSQFQHQNGGQEMRPKCELCAGERHFPYRCRKFKAMRLTDRLAHVAKLKMCFNCFSSKHMAASCGRPKCPRCQEGHNSTLCPRNPEIETGRSMTRTQPSVTQTASTLQQ